MERKNKQKKNNKTSSRILHCVLSYCYIALLSVYVTVYVGGGWEHVSE